MRIATPQTLELHVAQTVECTEAEGPGKRFAIWLQGCPLRCSGCCNPEMLPFQGGEKVLVDDMLQAIRIAAQQQGIEGITLMGGEPFAQPIPVGKLCQQVRMMGLSVMVFSGWELPELHAQASTIDGVRGLLESIDILVDGPYDREQPDTSRRWIGSRNQQIHFFTDRYSAADSCWFEADTMEIRLDGTQLLINGFPAKHAKSLWRKIGGA